MFRREKETKIFGLKNAMEREIRKFLTFVMIRQIASKIFRKNNTELTEALVISRRLKYP